MKDKVKERIKLIKLNIMPKMNLFHNTGKDAFEFEGNWSPLPNIGDPERL